MAKFAIIKEVTIYKKDIVKIKFKKLEDILKDLSKEMSPRNVMDNYELGSHLDALIHGGCFLVHEAISDGNRKKHDRNRVIKSSRPMGSPQPPTPPSLDEIVIEDHLNEGTRWHINADLIESIEIVQAEESYFSEEHQLSLMKIDGALYINGALLTKHDSKILHFFEQCLGDSIIKNLLDVDFDAEEDNENYN